MENGLLVGQPSADQVVFPSDNWPAGSFPPPSYGYSMQGYPASHANHLLA